MAAAIEIAIGTTIAALAVLLVVSEMSTATITTTIVTPSRLETPRLSESDSPTTVARPVSLSSVPSVMPPPNRMTVPQSIRAAWFQLSVKRRRAQSTGSTNSSAAARIATMPSLAASLTCL